MSQVTYRRATGERANQLSRREKLIAARAERAKMNITVTIGEPVSEEKQSVRMLQPDEIAALRHHTGNMYCETTSYRCVHLETVQRNGQQRGDCWFYDVMVGVGDKRFPRCADCVKYRGKLPEVSGDRS